MNYLNGFSPKSKTFGNLKIIDYYKVDIFLLFNSFALHLIKFGNAKLSNLFSNYIKLFINKQVKLTLFINEITILLISIYVVN